jgi:hypothetical protein
MESRKGMHLERIAYLREAHPCTLSQIPGPHPQTGCEVDSRLDSPLTGPGSLSTRMRAKADARPWEQLGARLGPTHEIVMISLRPCEAVRLSGSLALPILAFCASSCRRSDAAGLPPDSGIGFGFPIRSHGHLSFFR